MHEEFPPPMLLLFCNGAIHSIEQLLVLVRVPLLLLGGYDLCI